MTGDLARAPSEPEVEESGDEQDGRGAIGNEKRIEPNCSLGH